MVRGIQESPRTPGCRPPPDTTARRGNPSYPGPREPTARRYRPRTGVGSRAGQVLTGSDPNPGPRPDRTPRAYDPNRTTPMRASQAQPLPFTRLMLPAVSRYVVQWGNLCQSVSSPHQLGGGSRILRAPTLVILFEKSMQHSATDRRQTHLQTIEHLTVTKC